MACKCYYNGRSGWIFGYGEEELINESSAIGVSVRTELYTESGITSNRKNFAKSS